MKPDGALDLSISSDLSECALESAMEMMGIDLKNITSKEFQKGPYGHLKISIASQQMSLALWLKDRLFKPKNLRTVVEIDFGYQPNEWSLSLWEITGVGENYSDKTSIVWCEGA